MTQLSMSAHLLREEALKRGIVCETFDNEHLIRMSKDGKTWYTMGSRTSMQSSVGRSIADDKRLTKQNLVRDSIPTAKFCSVSSETDLTRLQELKFPVVMKPVGGNQGIGVVVGILNSESAREHYLAQKEEVLFEEQMHGLEYRVVCVNFQMVAASYRKPAFVTGDGVHSIAELIELKNADPRRSDGHLTPLTKMKIDSLVEGYLQEQNLEVSAILQAGKEVFVRKTANLSTGGEAEDVTDRISSENKETFEHIARMCDLNTIGIDVMCDSLDVPITQQPNAGIIEVNGSPGLRMHHFPMIGRPRNVAGAILDMVEKKYG